jgi:hypothetical protein
MGKKRRIIANKKKFGKKYNLHPSLSSKVDVEEEVPVTEAKTEEAVVEPTTVTAKPKPTPAPWKKKAKKTTVNKTTGTK